MIANRVQRDAKHLGNLSARNRLVARYQVKDLLLSRS
jgi:hypothetical protein